MVAIQLRVFAGDERAHTVVVLQTGGPVPMPWIGQVDGILQLYYGGGEQGRALADVFFGDVNPSGRRKVLLFDGAGL
jgi:hypothetical protein